MAEPRRTFGPVVLTAGLAAGALAMAGTQTWFTPEGKGVIACDESCPGYAVGGGGAGWSLALVMIACLGVLLVSRGLVRRLLAALGLLAAIGALVSVVGSYLTDRDDVRRGAEQLGATSVDVSVSGWFWIAAVAGALSLPSWLASVAYVRDWPEMGRKYDAPTDAPADAPPDDLWKAMDQGHDPTS